MTLTDALVFSVNGLALAYGGCTDWKRREIPNLVPLTLILTGLLHWRTLPLRLLCMAAAIFILRLSAKMAKSPLPGGDFKLLCALAFSAGPAVTLAVTVLTGLAAASVGLITGKRLRRNIPLCTYVCFAYPAALGMFLLFSRIFQ